MNKILLLVTVLTVSWLKVCSQKVEFLVGLGTTYSFTAGNTNYFIEPDFFPTVITKNAKEIGVNSTKTLKWINTKNYFGLDPSAELGFHLGNDFTIGLGLYGRHREVEYDLFLPAFEGLTAYSHHFNMDLLFMASTIYCKFYSKSHKWNISLNLGFNVPITKLDREGTFDMILHNYHIKEAVTGPVKSPHNTLDFANYPLYRIGYNRKLSDRIEFGILFEKQFSSYYGVNVQINDAATNQEILLSSIYGNDLTIGLRLSYNIVTPLQETTH